MNNIPVYQYDAFVPSPVQKPKTPSIFQAGIVFSAGVLTLVVASLLGGTLFANSIMLQTIVNEIGMLAVTVGLLLAFKCDLKTTLRLRLPTLGQSALTAAATVVIIPGALMLATVGIMIVEYFFGNTQLPDLSITPDASGFVMVVLISIFPAICEEALMRGAVFSGLERLGPTAAIILSSVLFGLLHMDFQRFIAQAVLGALAATAVYLTNSIFAGAIVHFLNNFLATLLSFILTFFTSTQPAQESLSILDSLREIAEGSGLSFEITFVSMLVIYIIGALFFCLMSGLIMFGMSRLKSCRASTPRNKLEKPQYAQLLMLLPGVFITLVMYLLTGIALSIMR